MFTLHVIPSKERVLLLSSLNFFRLKRGKEERVIPSCRINSYLFKSRLKLDKIQKARNKDKMTYSPNVDPAIDPNTSPYTNPNPAPVIDPNLDPYADPDPEPSVDPNTEPYSDPTPDPVIDPNTDPYTNPEIR